MIDIAQFFKRLLKEKENPHKVRTDVISLKKNYRKIHYCYYDGGDPYSYIELVHP
jgi:glycine hydroxymethyltransferase